jgi:hypothetical protein
VSYIISRFITDADNGHLPQGDSSFLEFNPCIFILNFSLSFSLPLSLSLSLPLSLSLSLLSLSLNTFSPQMPSRVRSPISSVTLTNLQHSQSTPPLPPPPPLSRLSSASRSICTYSESELVWHSSKESTARCCWTCGAGFWRRKRRR